MEKEKKQEQEVVGSLDNFYLSEEENCFEISFEKIFNKDEISVYDSFNLRSKRNFKNISRSILETYQELFLDEKGDLKQDEEITVFLYNVLNLNYKILLDSMSFDTFSDLLKNLLLSNNEFIIKEISNFVEENYSLDLDKITEEAANNKKKINQSLQFTDEHAKLLLKISYLYRITIPIISQFFICNKDNFYKKEKENSSILDEDGEDLEIEEMNSKIFSILFNSIAKENSENIRNKIYRLVFSRVIKTAYSDKRFWLAAKNIGITKDSVTLEIYKKILTNAIPKLSIDKNVISFLQSVINNQIDFLFQNKFKYRLQPIGGQNFERYSDNDDEISEFEKLEILMLRNDEGKYFLRKLNIKQKLEELPEILEIKINNEELREIEKTITKHIVQERIVSLFAMKYFEDKMVTKFLSFTDYCKLVLLCKKFLIKHKFVFLPIILTAKCEKHRERTGISGKKVRPLIEDSKKYNELFNSKYKNFKEEIEKPLASIIGTTYSSIFKDSEGNELFDSSVKVAKIADELIDLAFLV